MTRIIVVLSLLVTWPAFAQSETEAPDAEAESEAEPEAETEPEAEAESEPEAEAEADTEAEAEVDTETESETETEAETEAETEDNDGFETPENDGFETPENDGFETPESNETDGTEQHDGFEGFETPEGGEGSGLEGLSLEELLSVEIVESASRRQQSIHDAPSAVTLVPRDVIASMGVYQVPEIMRRVPGALVLRTAANSYRVVLRDVGTLVSNRVPLLLDGRPVFDGITNLPSWQWLPISVEEIERVEAIRGPGSTLYGANAQGGVISLTTRRPVDAVGFSGRLLGGLNYLPPDGDDGAVLNAASAGSLAYGVANDARTLGARASFGYQITPEWTRPEGSEPFRRGQYRYHARLTLQWHPNDDTEVLAWTSQSDAELFSLTAGDPSSSVFRFREQSWSVRGRTRIADALNLRIEYDSAYVRFTTNEFGKASQWQHGLRIQGDLSLFDDRSRTTLSLELARLNVTRLPAVTPERNTYSLVLQEEVVVVEDKFLVSAAGRFDLARYDDNGGIVIRYRNANPRVSMIWRPAPNHDLRLTAATAFRTPNPIEVSSGVRRPPPGPDDPPIPFVIPNPQLVPERVRSIELGYRGDLVSDLRTELVVFLQETRNTVLVTSAEALPLIYQNTGTVNQIGFEMDLRYSPIPRFSAYGHYRFLRSEADSETRNIWPRHVGSVGLDGELGQGVTLHADFSWVVGIAQQELGAIEGTPIITSGFVTSNNLYDANLTLSKRILEERVRVFGSVRNIGAFFRDRAGTLQGLPGFSSPIGATILVGLEVEPTGG